MYGVLLSMVTLREVVMHQRHATGLYNTVWDSGVQATLLPLAPEVTVRHRKTLSDVMTSEISEFCLSSQRLENN